jgi:hypothetical protein
MIPLVSCDSDRTPKIFGNSGVVSHAMGKTDRFREEVKR